MLVHFGNPRNKTSTGQDGGANSNEQDALWGVVTGLAKGDTSELPPADDTRVVEMANVMYYFLIVFVASSLFGPQECCCACVTVYYRP